MNKYIVGLDSIRFLAAAWVVFAHAGTFPIFQEVDKSNFLEWLGNGIYTNLFSGPAAVIVFFVISGFVIHAPYYSGKEFNLKEFYVRRFLRISCPLIVAIILAVPLDVSFSFFEVSIVWSLFAEVIYYLLYPVIRTIKSHVSWKSFLGTSFLISFLVVLTNPTAGDYPSYGISLNWLLGLPCWLLGCYLAETKWKDYQISNRQDLFFSLNIWRLFVLFSSSFCCFLRGSTFIGYPWTLNLFAVLVFFWLRKEILYFNYSSGTSNKSLEKLGGFSYSLYLTHLLSLKMLSSSGLLVYGQRINWIIEIGFILGFSYFFYLIIESPSHKISRSVARRLRT